MANINPLWYKDAVFYELYVRAFYDSNGDGHGDLRGVISKLDYLQELGVDCIWLLPTYPSPLNDDGYDIADYYNVHPDYGTLDDFKALVEEIHARGMRVIVDLVLNHTSDQHPWFQEARRDPENPYRDYYVWSDTDKKYQDVRIIFLDTEESNWAWDEAAEKYYWHRFYASQPDLNYDNPKVREEMFKVVKFWLDLGVDGFRADAVPYLFEREGTISENLAETHVFLKELRSYITAHYPEAILLCEANQWPEDVRHYFGEGTDEVHMGFHFPLMPRIFMALGKADVSPIVEILERTPPIPKENQWCMFLRNHDELTLEMVTEEEREWMWEHYAPEARMRLNFGIRRRLAALLDNDRRRMKLLNSLLFTLPGSPIIYYGDEIGMGDNIMLADRNGVRTPMQWEASASAGFSAAGPESFYAPVVSEAPFDPAQVNVEAQHSDPESLLNTMKRMVAVRKEHRAFGWGEFAWLESNQNKTVAAYYREHQKNCLLVINNLSAEVQPVEFNLNLQAAGAPHELLSGEELIVQQNGSINLELGPYQYLWLKIT